MQTCPFQEIKALSMLMPVGHHVERDQDGAGHHGCEPEVKGHPTEESQEQICVNPTVMHHIHIRGDDFSYTGY